MTLGYDMGMTVSMNNMQSDFTHMLVAIALLHDWSHSVFAQSGAYSPHKATQSGARVFHGFSIGIAYMLSSNLFVAHSQALGRALEFARTAHKHHFLWTQACNGTMKAN